MTAMSKEAVKCSQRQLDWVRRKMVRVGSFVVLLFLLGCSLPTQSRAAQEGQERVSKPGEVQPDPKRALPVELLQ